MVFIKYRIAGNFRGRELLRFGGKKIFAEKHFAHCSLVSLPNDTTPPTFAEKTFVNNYKPQNSWKFSPSKVSRYTVCYTHTCKCACRHTHVHTQHMHIYTHTHMHTHTYKHICMHMYNIHMHEEPMNGACKKTDIQTHTRVGIPHTHVYLLFTVCCHGASGRANQHTSRNHFILFPTSKDWCAGLNHWQASRARVGCRERGDVTTPLEIVQLCTQYLHHRYYISTLWFTP